LVKKQTGEINFFWSNITVSKVGHGSVNVAWSRLQIILSLERALAASAAAAAAAASGRALRATVTPLPAFFATTA
jgi:hypothetical protein